MDKEIIDFGEIKVPEKWEDISLKKYQDISRYYSNNEDKTIIDLLPILLDKDKDYVMSLPEEFLEKILEKMLFLQEEPPVKPSSEIKIGKDTYVINYQNKLKTGEYIATDQAIKGDPYNYAAILAVLCRKEGEVYDSKFENEMVEERTKMFEQQPVTKILPTITFFLNLWMMLNGPSLLSSSIQEAINDIQANIEDLEKDGTVSKRFMRSVTKKLKKLKKSINSI